MTDVMIGSLVKAAIIQGVTWNTAVQAGANSQIEIDTEGITATAELIPQSTADGSIQNSESDLGRKFFRGPINLPAKYETLDLLLGLAFGAEAAAVQQGSDLAYLHRFTLVNSLRGKFGSLIFEKLLAEELHEYDSFKVNGFSFECMQGDQVAKFVFPIIARSLNLNVGSGVNNTTTWAAITMRVPRDRILFAQMVCRMNAQGGSALSGSDVRAVSGIKFEVSRALKEDDVTATGGRVIDEPGMNGKTLVKGSVMFSRYETANKALYAARLAATKHKLDCIFTGGIANGATNYSLAWYLNNVQFESGDPSLNNPGQNEFSLPFVASKVATAPSGFPAGTTGGITAELINAKSGAALA